jgi:CRISPR-associated endonuclease/helicase Cas3
MQTYYAHTDDRRSPDAWDLLSSHLEATARRCEQFCRAFGPQAGRLVGRWHDLGKYQPAFQRYLLRETLRGPKHSIVGAYRAYSYGRLDLAMIIAAHHGRLAEKGEFLNGIELGGVGECEIPASLVGPFPAEKPPSDAVSLWMRFIFSALVDADSLETETWDKGRPRWRCEDTMDRLIDLLECSLEEKRRGADSSEMNELRRHVQDACREHALDAMGAFRLTVPTGGGKTLASLLFALHHAKRHKLHRVIVVIPYTSIIEQTAQTYREIFGEQAVLEHHSSLDPNSDSLTNRHCVENWDSPIVVTTSVQFFETLHANRKKDLRKLHSVAESVVVLDEVQAFPLKLIKPIKDSLQRLTAHFRVTTVHCSATQPFLAQQEAAEIVPDHRSIFAITRGRVAAHWPKDPQQPVSWEKLAARIRGHEHGRVLAIVHRKQDSFDLARAIGDECIHLSTLMCPAHRREVLKKINNAVKAGKRCLVVSTQLVEAGVDLDFPVVYRALAGVDSLAQAAGRCNREGKLMEPGEFHIFVAPSEPPQGTLLEGFKLMRGYLKRGPVDPFDPDLSRRYFGDLKDLKGIASEIPALEKALNFPEVADKFRMIDDEGTPVIAPYGDWQERVAAVRAARTLDNFRLLQPLTVSLHKRTLDDMQAKGCLVRLENDMDEFWTVLPARQGVYSEKFGFAGDGGNLYYLET